MTDLAQSLREIVGADRLSVTDADRDLHAHDDSYNEPVRPDLVVWPRSTAEVAEIARLANETSTPITAWGAASSAGGHVIPVRRGIVMDFEQMNRIVEVDHANFQAVVQPGVLRLDLEDHLSRQGLFFAPDPGANATVGGMIANNAAGVRALKYGATRDNVLGLEVVLANGSIVRTGSRSIKQSSGYQLTQIFVGSEGTLGLVTEATLKLRPIPSHVATAIVGFPTVEAAAAAVADIMGLALEPAALELLAADHLRWMNEDEATSFAEVPTMLIEFTDASATSVEERMEAAISICRDHGAIEVGAVTDHAERANLWRVRHGVRHRYRRRLAGGAWIGMDVSVPVASFAELVSYAIASAEQNGFPGAVLGHAGDGNLHLGLGYPPGDDDARSRAHLVSGLLVDKAIELGGTCSGEHGIGLDKRGYMTAEHGRAAVEAMRAIKTALDPHNILNPEKVLPEP
ncbi:MAG: FAD-binding oxidoreductase [Acidimicrobiia bacterium]|nr:FAD-binding oxidoreductase [Acidimicrobiia bacterium]